MPHLQPEFDVALHCLPGEQRILLKHHTAIGAGTIDRFTIDGDATFGRLEEARHRIEQGGFAAAGRSDDRNEFSGIDMDRSIANRFDRALERVVAQAKIADVDAALRGRGCFAFAVFAHDRFHGMTSRPNPRISALDPRPSTPMQIIPSAISAYWTSE